MSNTPLVLLHGYCGSQLDFAHVRKKLDQIAPTIAYDHRGHGEARNEGATGTITLESLAEDLRAVLERNQINEAHLLGHSMGGKILLRFALAHPDRVKSMILLGTGANPVNLGPLPKHSWKDRARTLINRDAAARMAGALYATNEVRHRFTRVARKTATQTHPHTIAELHHAIIHAPSLVPRLKELRSPTTVMVGAHDNMFRADAAELANHIPNATLIVFAHSTHYPHFEQEPLFIEAVRQHFQRLETKTN